MLSAAIFARAGKLQDRIDECLELRVQCRRTVRHERQPVGNAERAVRICHDRADRFGSSILRVNGQ